EARQAQIRDSLTRDSSLEAADSVEQLEDVSDILEVREVMDPAPERGRWMFAFIGVAALGVVAVLFGVSRCTRSEPMLAAGAPSAAPTLSAAQAAIPASVAPAPSAEPAPAATESAAEVPSAAPSAEEEE